MASLAQKVGANTLWTALALTLLLAGCTASGCMWPGRPNCEPVGTTVVVESVWRDDPSCTETRYYDEMGEARFREMGCA